MYNNCDLYASHNFDLIDLLIFLAFFRVPQSLLFLNILEYDKILMDKLVKGEESSLSLSVTIEENIIIIMHVQ